MQHHRASRLRVEVVGNEKCPVIYFVVESENPCRILRQRNSRESLLFLLFYRSNGQCFVLRLRQVKAVVVDEINDDIYSIAGGASEKGTGGFQTKIKAAEIATSEGIPVIIMNGEKPTDLYKVLSGESIGTYFKAKGDENA